MVGVVEQRRRRRRRNRKNKEKEELREENKGRKHEGAVAAQKLLGTQGREGHRQPTDGASERENARQREAGGGALRD